MIVRTLGKRAATAALAAAASAAFFLSALPAASQTLTSLADIARVNVLPGWRTADGTYMAAVHIALKEGWKTYWRSPGEAGIPPSFDWSGSQNLAAVRLHWPTPHVFTANGLRSIGYKGDIVLPLELTPRKGAGTPVSLRGTMQIGVCEDICIPMTFELAADLIGSGAPDAAIRRSLADTPVPGIKAGLRSSVCRIEPSADGLRLTAVLDLPPVGKDELAVVELPDRTVWIAEATTRRTGRVLSAQTDLVPTDGKPFALERSDVRITVLADGKAVEVSGCTAG